VLGILYLVAETDGSILMDEINMWFSLRRRRRRRREE